MTRPRTAPSRPRRQTDLDASLTAVLGPTNTGKTHLAVERMLAHESGMIGLPLRLLAREVYDRICRLGHAGQTALITGEEKIIPARARFFVCTVEAMPVGQRVAFLAIDEIQLCADPERGHVFTDRLLHARGLEETMFLGSQTVRRPLTSLLPDIKVTTRSRFSELSWTGARKLTRLPRRAAIVAFSADQVYAIAELIRRQRGGAAVVMGALSPRTRNAQVELYQNGDVDFLVATDAIGMGLNMDIDHVAFAATSKFDGRVHRPLRASELAQIAGRAGRHMNDGTFGTSANAGLLTPEMIEQIENHRFEPEPVLQWRNTELDFSSLTALLRSLDVSPRDAGLGAPLTRTAGAADLDALSRMIQNPDIARLAIAPAAIKRLWEVAQVPDFRKTLATEHAGLLSQLYLYLMSPEGLIPEDWLDDQLTRVDHTHGDIDALAARIAHTRTWTFVSNRTDWLKDPGHWQARARQIEDRLSDALHERLTLRFVDRRTSVLMKRLRQKEDLMAAVNSDGEVLVEGEYVGRLSGFIFVPDPRAEGVHAKALRAASDQALAQEITNRATQLSAAPDGDIHLSEHGQLIWQGAPVAHLTATEDPLAPLVELTAGTELDAVARAKVLDRLGAWTTHHVATILKPLLDLKQAEDVDGLARGIAFRLVENLGVLPRDQVAEDIRALDQTARGQLRKYGVRFGAYSIFMPLLLKPAPAHLLLMLWALGQEKHGPEKNGGTIADLPTPPAPGLTSVIADKAAPKGFYAPLGFRVCGNRAVRLDMLERLADLIRPIITARTFKGGFIPTPDMMSLVGCSGEELASILRGLGYRSMTIKLPASALAAPQANAPEAKSEETVKEKNTDAQTQTAPDVASAEAPPQAGAPPAPNPAETAHPEAAKETEAAGEAEAASPTAEAGAAETASEHPIPAAEDQEALVEVEIWRPMRRHDGPSRRQNKVQRGKSAKAKTANGKADTLSPAPDAKSSDARSGDAKSSDTRPKKAKPRKQKRPPKQTAGPRSQFARRPADKPIDPDSPFAALAALKQPAGKK